jgi:hypothetical protein
MELLLVLKFLSVMNLCSFRRRLNPKHLCAAIMSNIKPLLYKGSKTTKNMWCSLVTFWSWGCYSLKYVSLGVSHVLAYILKHGDISYFRLLCIFLFNFSYLRMWKISHFLKCTTTVLLPKGCTYWVSTLHKCLANYYVASFILSSIFGESSTLWTIIVLIKRKILGNY